MCDTYSKRVKPKNNNRQKAEQKARQWMHETLNFNSTAIRLRSLIYSH